MMKFEWKNFGKKIWCLAPMEGVTDTVFRQMIASLGRPDVMFTEFTSVDGLYSKGYEFVKSRLEYDVSEKPLIAQIWGLEPKNFYKAAQMLVEKGFDGIDINMGCPDKAVIRSGACSALINNRELALKTISESIRGVNGKLPVSVKIRTGFDKHDTESWVEDILSLPIDALTVHGRTTKQMSKVAADWDEIAKAVKVRDRLKHKAVIIGNGDAESIKEGRIKCEKYGVDGVMFGRAIFKNPWLFDTSNATITKKMRTEVLIRHTKLFEKTWGKTKPFQVMKKFFKIYLDGFHRAKIIRAKLMECKSYEEFYETFNGLGLGLE